MPSDFFKIQESEESGENGIKYSEENLKELIRNTLLLEGISDDFEIIEMEYGVSGNYIKFVDAKVKTLSGIKNIIYTPTWYLV